MIRKDVIFAVLATFCLCALMFAVIPINSQLPYDPWIDIDEDGKINMYDVGYSAQRFGAAGDPTKNVNVTNWPTLQNVDVINWPQQQNVNVLNWPVASQQTVFSFQNATALSKWYNASGFGHMHLTWYFWDLADPESITITVSARMELDQGYTVFGVNSLVVTDANSEGGVSFPVPSELFRFELYFSYGTEAHARLAFYLTYA